MRATRRTGSTREPTLPRLPYEVVCFACCFALVDFDLEDGEVFEADALAGWAVDAATVSG